MKKVFLLLITISIFPLCLPTAKAATTPTVLINEIAWMGTTTSANDEWIELFNPTEDSMNLTGWALKTADGKLNVSLKGTIPAKSFYLLERTDDTSVPTITADLIYKGALSNAGEDLQLYNSSNSMVDQANYPYAWPAGNASTKKTMERTSEGAWHTSQMVNGTPKATNTNIITVQPLPKSVKSSNNVSVTPETASALVQNTASVNEKAEPLLPGKQVKSNLAMNGKTDNPWILFLTALSIALISAIIIVIVTIKTKRYVRS